MNKLMLGLCMSAALFCGFSVNPASAAYPERSITMIVPFGAGGSTDLVARFIGNQLEKRLGKTVIVKNIVGTSGILGTTNLADSKPDGYTIGLIPIAPLVMQPNFRQTSYKLENFDSIARVTNDPLYLEVSAKSPIKTLADMAAAIKKNPEKSFYGHLGQGSQIHLAIAHVFKKMGLDPKPIIFKGDPDAMQAMAADRIQYFVSLPAILSSYEIRPIAVLSEKRVPTTPDVATAKEQNVDIVYTQWMALVGPKGMPAEITKKLCSTFEDICKDPQYIKDLAGLNTKPDFLNSEDNMKFMKAEEELYKKIMPEIYGQKK